MHVKALGRMGLLRHSIRDLSVRLCLFFWTVLLRIQTTVLKSLAVSGVVERRKGKIWLAIFKRVDAQPGLDSLRGDKARRLCLFHNDCVPC
jgi:hypothetical protein